MVLNLRLIRASIYRPLPRLHTLRAFHTSSISPSLSPPLSTASFIKHPSSPIGKTSPLSTAPSRTTISSTLEPHPYVPTIPQPHALDPTSTEAAELLEMTRRIIGTPRR